MKTYLAYALELSALVLVSYGAWSIYRPAGLIVGAISAFGYAQGIK